MLRNLKPRSACLAAALFLLPTFLAAYSSNPPLGRTGAPGESTCASCHSPLKPNTSVALHFPGALTYTPGGSAINLSVNAPSPSSTPGIGGFELSSRSSSGQAGAFTPGTNSGINTQNNFQYIFHTSPQMSWSFTWTPPTTNVGAVTFYLVGVDSVGQTYTNTYVLSPVVSTPTDSITASPATVTFNYNAAPLATQSVSVSSSGAALAFTIATSTVSGGNWLSATPAGGNTPMNLTVSANPAGLSVGQYTGTITVTSATASNSPQTVAVTLNVISVPPPTRPTLTLSPATLNFSSSASAPQHVQVKASDNSAQSFTAVASTSTGGSWLAVTPGSGSTPSTVSVSVDTTSLAAGTYHGTINFTSAGVSNSPLPLAVTLVVGPPPPPPTTSTALHFTFTAVDKQSAGTDSLLIDGTGSVDKTGKIKASGRFTRFLPSTSDDDDHKVVATGTWKATSVVSFTPASPTATSGGVLVIKADFAIAGGKTESATVTISDTGSQSGVTVDIPHDATFVPGSTAHVSIVLGNAPTKTCDN